MAVDEFDGTFCSCCLTAVSLLERRGGGGGSAFSSSLLLRLPLPASGIT